MRKFFPLLVLLTLQSLQSLATTPVWSTDVAPILYNHCTSCHHPGGIAPFSLITYNDAVLNAMTMKSDVMVGKMPPWPPNKSYAHLAHERILSTTEVNTIVNWVNASTPSGNISLAPPVPVYSPNGMLPGTPDLILKIPPYTSTAATSDVYQCFSIPSGLLADKHIVAFEAVPGNPACVHHVLVYADTTGTCAALDAASPGPGYTNFGGVGSSSASLIGAWVPGTAPMTYPNGFGVRLANHSDVVLQIHYPAGTTGMVDSTEVHFFFSTAPTIREVYITPILNYFTNIDSPLSISANTVRSFHEDQVSPFDLSLIGLAPHMHLIGTTIKSYGIHPAGDTDKFIYIPKWDFHWQGFYEFPKIKYVPAGTRLRAEASYDNTPANPENPSSPPLNVVAGENTTDEMMLVYFIYSAYMPGDENIIIDSAAALSATQQFMNYYHGQQLLDVCPNPAVNDLIVKCFFDEADMGTIDLLDMQGAVVKRFMANEQINRGYSVFTYSVSGVAAGTYSLRMQTLQRVFSQKIVVVH